MNTLERIEKLFDDHNWYMYKLSKNPVISQSTISNMFNQNNDHSMSVLDDICKRFGLTLYLFCR